MSFGYSIGDFVALSQLAWKVYHKCRDSPSEYRQLADDVRAVHTALDSVEAQFNRLRRFIPNADEEDAKRQAIATRCLNTIHQIQENLDRYDTLKGSVGQRIRLRHRFQWSFHSVAKLRDALQAQ